MKKNKKKAFTLVELLAVIVILAVILVIAIPQIMNTIKAARLSSIKDSAMLIAEQAEKDYISQQVLNKDYSETSIPCSDVAKLNDDYASCNITYNNGVATVKLKGASNGKFAGITCTGTKDSMECKSKTPLLGYSDAVEYFTNLCDNTTGCNDASNTSGLIKTNGTELRYRGSNPNNYVTFNDEVAGWRIVGIFDGRVKLVKKTSLGSYSWDTSVQEGDDAVNKGWGVNEWSKSDLMNELNGDYLDTTLTYNTTWYNGRGNKKTATFTYTNRLSSEAQELIDDATWYLGGFSASTTSVTDLYLAERGSSTCQTANTIGCVTSKKNDGVERTTRWIGKIGLIYPSDYGYASGNRNCVTNMGTDPNCDSNWMKSYGWTISPQYLNATYAWYASATTVPMDNVSSAKSVRPSLYLIQDIQIKGSGTSSDPYVFAK